jgi:flagellar basal body P-ring protein FlgI
MALQYSATIYLARLDQIEVSTGTSAKLNIYSGDLSVNGTITSGQTVSVTSFTVTAANT